MTLLQIRMERIEVIDCNVIIGATIITRVIRNRELGVCLASTRSFAVHALNLY